MGDSFSQEQNLSSWKPRQKKPGSEGGRGLRVRESKMSVITYNLKPAEGFVRQSSWTAIAQKRPALAANILQ